VKVSRAGVIYGLTAVATMGWTMFQQYRVETMRGRLSMIQDEVDRCGRVQLLNTREDVIAVMGPPVREETVASVTGGSARRLYYRFAAVDTPHLPYVDVDDHFKKVVAVDCMLSNHSLDKLVKTNKAMLPKEEALPTDRKRF